MSYAAEVEAWAVENRIACELEGHWTQAGIYMDVHKLTEDPAWMGPSRHMCLRCGEIVRRDP